MIIDRFSSLVIILQKLVFSTFNSLLLFTFALKLIVLMLSFYVGIQDIPPHLLVAIINQA
jgi:hypothetical protein